MKLQRTIAKAFMFAVLLLLPVVSFRLTFAKTNAAIEPQKSRPTRRPAKKIVPKTPTIDYSQLSHRTHVEKEKLACDSCHKFPSKNWKEVRKGDEAFPDVSDFPEHASCLNCHRQQFFARQRPAPLICSNCHVQSSPRDSSRYLFPSLGDVSDTVTKRRTFVSEFSVGFPHDKHLDVVGFNAPVPGGESGLLFLRASYQEKKEAMPKSCPTCHQTYQPQGNSSEEYATKAPKNIGDNFWLKKGTFKTIPNSHAVCFTCHNPDSGIAPEPKDCNACHKLVAIEAGMKFDSDPKLVAAMGINDNMIIARWNRRTSAGAFRHEGGEHPDVSCMRCHNVATLSTVDLKTLKVPLRSCGGADGCHITATTDDGGALNFEVEQKKKDPAFVCTKCHITFGRQAVPEGHAQAIPTPKVKAN
jgi:hypothetical protein